MDESKLKRGNNAFDLIRVICCLIVVYEHTVGMGKISLWSAHVQGLAVDCFFILSGFWVTNSFERSKNIREYALGRCKRLLPAYYLIIFATVFILGFYSKWGIRGFYTSWHTWKYFFCNLIFCNFLQQTLPGVFEGNPWDGAVNGALWTMKIEVGFYIVLPILVFIKKKINSSRVSIVLSIMLIFLSAILECFYARLGIPEVLGHQLPSFISYFICGMILHYGYVYFENFTRNIRGLLLFVAAFALLLLRYMGIFGIWVSVLMPFLLSWIVFFIGIRFTALGGLIQRDLSYPMYLIHFPIVQLMIWKKMIITNGFLGLVSVICITFSAAYCADYLIRKIKWSGGGHLKH